MSVRVAARIDIKSCDVIKGIHFDGVRVVGVPAEMATRYYAEGADEIIYVDAVASLYGRNNILDMVTEAARDIFVPLTVGGGIRSLADISAALRAGADKVAINTEAIRNPKFLTEAARAFGSQCVVLLVEARRRQGWWEAMVDYGRDNTGVDVLKWVVEAERLGVGEVLLTSVDTDGTRSGFDIELMREVRARVDIPVIAGGGCGSPQHVVDLLSAVDIDAVSCASLFHYKLASIAEVKAHMLAAGIEVRR